MQSLEKIAVRVEHHNGMPYTNSVFFVDDLWCDVCVSEVIDGNIGLTDQSKMLTTNIDTIQLPVRNCHLREHKP